MRPGGDLRRCLTTDCDHRTCTEALRPALADGAYVADGQATRQTLHRCFHLLASFFMLKGTDEGEVQRRVKECLASCFGCAFGN